MVKVGRVRRSKADPHTTHNLCQLKVPPSLIWFFGKGVFDPSIAACVSKNVGYLLVMSGPECLGINVGRDGVEQIAVAGHSLFGLCLVRKASSGREHHVAHLESGLAVQGA